MLWIVFVPVLMHIFSTAKTSELRFNQSLKSHWWFKKCLADNGSKSLLPVHWGWKNRRALWRNGYRIGLLVIYGRCNSKVVGSSRTRVDLVASQHSIAACGCIFGINNWQLYWWQPSNEHASLLAPLNASFKWNYTHLGHLPCWIDYSLPLQQIRFWCVITV